MRKEYDAVVIGSGVSGLAIAGLLAKQGKETLVLERSPIVGGRAFTREFNGYVIDNGPKMIVEIPTEPWPNGVRPTYPDGDPRTNLWQGDLIGPITAVMEHLGTGYHLSPENDGWMVYEAGTFRDIRELYASSKDELKRVYGLITAIDDADFHRLDGVSVSDWARTVTDNPEVIRLMDVLSINTFVESTAKNIAAGCFLYCLKYCLTEMRKVLWSAYPIGGFGAVIKALQDALEALGGEVVTRASVVDVRITDGVVRGVEADIGDHDIPTEVRSSDIDAPLVVITTPIWSFSRLVRPEHLQPWYAEFVAHAAKHQIGILGFYLGTTEPVAGSGEYFSWDEGPHSGVAGMIVDNSVLDSSTTPSGQFLAGTACYPSQEQIADPRWVRWALKAFRADCEELFPRLRDVTLWSTDYVAGPTTGTSYGLAEAPYCSGLYRPGSSIPGVKGLYMASGSLSEYGVGSDQACRSVLRCMDRIAADGA
jgi:phytoene dehydrogenase-like protein